MFIFLEDLFMLINIQELVLKGYCYIDANYLPLIEGLSLKEE